MALRNRFTYAHFNLHLLTTIYVFLCETFQYSLQPLQIKPIWKYMIKHEKKENEQND